jgi:hypothetical protein
MYMYDPKWKHTLPWYDRFPVGFLVNRAKGGHYLLNMHYLPPLLRVKLFDALRNELLMGQGTQQRIRMTSLEQLSQHRLIQPCCKRYLSNNLRSRMFVIEPDEWEYIMFLPLARWEKGGKGNHGNYGGSISPNKVYSDSRKKISG